MKALEIERPLAARVRDLPDPVPGPGEVVVRVKACGICGTDVHIFRGEYLGGYPIVPGHEISGVVASVGPDVTNVATGDRVAIEPNLSCGVCRPCRENRQNFCERWQAIGVTLPGGMAELVGCPASAVFGVGDLPFEQAAFMEPLSCVVHGLDRAGVRSGDRVLVFGAGPVGILLLRLLFLEGAGHLTVVERNPARLAFARRSGAALALEGTNDLAPDAYDVVVEATGAPSLQALAPRFARHGGTVLYFGVPPAKATITIEPFQLFRKGLSLVGTYTSLRTSLRAVALLESRRLPVGDLVSHRLGLADFSRGIEAMTAGTDDVMKVMLSPER